MWKKKLWLAGSLARYIFLLGVSLLDLLLHNSSKLPPLMIGAREIWIVEFGSSLGSYVGIIPVQYFSFPTLAHQSGVFVNNSWFWEGIGPYFVSSYRGVFVSLCFIVVFYTFIMWGGLFYGSLVNYSKYLWFGDSQSCFIPGCGTLCGVSAGELVLSLLLSHNGLSRIEGYYEGFKESQRIHSCQQDIDFHNNYKDSWEWVAGSHSCCNNYGHTCTTEASNSNPGSIM